MKRLAISVALLVILAGLAAWWFSDTQVLKRRTESLLTTLTLDSGSGNVNRQMGTYALSGLLAEQVELENPTIQEGNGTFERTELESVYSWLCNQCKQSRFELQKFHAVTVDGDTAQLSFSLNALVELPTYRPADGKFDVHFTWKKAKDGWRITRASWKPVP